MTTTIENVGQGSDTTTPAWRRVPWPDPDPVSLARDTAIEWLARASTLDYDDARERTERVLKGVIGNRSWVSQGNFDQVQKLLFGGSGEPTGAIYTVESLKAELAEVREALIARTVERDDLLADKLTCATTIQSLRANVNEAVDKRRAAENGLAAFKKQVTETASRYAAEHGWCEVVDEALDELGLERASSTYTGTLVIRVNFRAELADRSNVDRVDETWVRHSLACRSTLTDNIRDHFLLDDDWGDEAITDITFDIEDIERENP